MLTAISEFELGLLRSINTAVASPFLDAVMKFITFTGNAGIIWIICAVIMLCIPKTRRGGITLALALVLCLVLNNLLLKNIIARPRPFHIDPTLALIIPKPSEFSFPSGHTLTSFAAAEVIWRYCGSKYGIIAAVWALLMGLSRIYLMVHFPTDVIGGAVIGVMIGCLAVIITNIIFKKNKSKNTSL